MKNILNTIVNKAKNIGFKIDQHAPTILIGVGIIGGIAASVLACKSTIKAKEKIDETKKSLENLEDAKSKIENQELIEEDITKIKNKIYTSLTLNLVKEYSLPLVIGGLSIACILSANNIARKRFVAMASAYTILDKGFKEYRKNVVEKYGKEVDYELKTGLKVEEKEIEKVGKDGKIKKVKIKENKLPEGYSDYCKYFDEYSSKYKRDSEYNLMFLNRQQEYANEILKSRGHLFLNEVYDMLGIPRTKAGQIVGWRYDKNNPEKYGDGYIDFGLFDGKDSSRYFINGVEHAVLLDFNVDGAIIENI